MIPSVNMGRQKGSGRGPQAPKPKGPLITVGPEEREQLKARRLKLELDQKQLATRAKVTAGTISNIETGRHPQIKREVYARLRRALRINGEAPAEQTEETYRAIVDGALDLDETNARVVAALIDSLKRK